MVADLVTGTNILERRHQILEERRTDESRSLRIFSDWLRQHAILASLLILGCAVTPRLFLTATTDLQDLLTRDSSTYLWPALNLLSQGEFLNSHMKPEVDRTPGYPVFLAGIIALVGQNVGDEDVRMSLVAQGREDLREMLIAQGGQGLRRIFMVQTAILSWSVVFVYWLARRILPPVMAFTGALLAALSPWGAVFAGLCLTEGAYIFLLAGIFLCMKLAVEANRVSVAVWRSAGVGLLTASAVLVRPLWPIILLVAAALVIQYGLNRKGVWLVLTVMIMTATLPVGLWKARNAQEAHFNGISTNGPKTIWRCLAARVQGIVEERDAALIYTEHLRDESRWLLSIQEANDERWRRSIALFREHPILTVYSFIRSAGEHILHPMPYTSRAPAKLYFSGGHWILHPLWGVYILFWGGYLGLACLGLWYAADHTRSKGAIDRDWLVVCFGISVLLVVVTGVSYGGGSRMRVSLEPIIPLLAGVGLIRVLQSVPGLRVGS